MTRGWCVRTAFRSAAKGWVVTWLCVGAYFVLRSPKTHIHSQDAFAILVIWLISTAAVTGLTTGVFIVPYVCIVQPRSLHCQPWRLFVEPALLVCLATLCLTPVFKPSADNFWRSFLGLFPFAFLACELSAAFYWKALRRFWHEHQAEREATPR